MRAREAAKKDQLRARHRLGKFLLRHGQRPTEAGKSWTKKYLEGIKTHVRFKQPALEATLAHYLHEVEHAAEQILKLEKAIVEAAWAYQHRPNVTGFLLRKQKSLALGDEVKQIAWKAQHRLHKRYQALALRGKNKNQIVTALGRELLGSIWAIAVHTEAQCKLLQAA